MVAFLFDSDEHETNFKFVFELALTCINRKKYAVS